MKAKRALSSLFATAACARHFTTLRSTPWTSRIDSHAIGAVTTDGWSSKPTFRTMLLTRGGADSSAASDDSIVPPLQDPENDESVLAVQRLGGWSAEEAKDALANANGNVQLAHANLAAAEEAELLATQAAGLAELTAKGYDAEGKKTMKYAHKTFYRNGLKFSRVDTQYPYIFQDFDFSLAYLYVDLLIF